MGNWWPSSLENWLPQGYVGSNPASSAVKFMEKELHRITSTAIIYRDGKYLLLRRSLEKKAFPGKWTVPGGGLETDDYTSFPKTTNDHWYFAVANSLRREITEETGLEVGTLEYLLDIAFIRPDGIPVIILSYYCPYKSGEIQLDEDSMEYAWVTYEETKQYDLIEGISEEIEMVDKILKGEQKDRIQFQG